MHPRVYGHLQAQKEVLKKNIEDLDAPDAKKDLEKVDKLYSDLKKGHNKSAEKILEDLAEKYKHKYSMTGLQEAGLITSIITSILLSVSLAIGIHKAFPQKSNLIIRD